MLLYIVIAAVVALVIALFIAAHWVLYATSSDIALVRTSALRGRTVHSGGPVLVLPFMENATYLSLEPVELTIERRGWAGLVFADDEHVDATARLTVKLLPDADNVLRMSRLLGGRKATDPEALGRLLGPALSDALKQVAARMGTECLRRPERLGQRALKELGRDLDGYTLEGLEVSFPGLSAVERREGPFR